MGRIKSEKEGECAVAGLLTYFGDFTKGASLFSEVDDDAAASLLRFLDSLLNAVDKVRSACADIGAEDIASVALQMY